jgi:hypothetical protein
MLKQAASQCIQTTSFDRAALILEVRLDRRLIFMTARANSRHATQCLEPWTRNYGRLLLRASDDAAREKVQEIVQVLFKYTSQFPSMFKFCMGRACC